MFMIKVIIVILMNVQLRAQEAFIESYFSDLENGRIEELSEKIHPRSLFHFRSLLIETTSAISETYPDFDDENFKILGGLLSDSEVSDSEVFVWSLSNLIDPKSMAPGFKPEFLGKIDSPKDGRVFVVIDSPLTGLEEMPGRATFLITILLSGEEFKIFDIDDFTKGILKALMSKVQEAERKGKGVSP